MTKTPKAPWIPPSEDVATLYETILTHLNAGGCVSIKDATDRAFTALRQPNGAWGNKPYGPSVTKTMQALFTEEQTAELQAFFPKMAPLPPTNQSHTVGEKFERNPELRERFLTSIAQGHSRAELTVEFDVPIERVKMALTAAISGQTSKKTKHPQYSSSNHYARQWFRRQIDDVAAQKPEWEPLSKLIASERGISVGGWTDVPTQDEIDLSRRLQLEADKKFKAGSTTLNDDGTHLINSGAIDRGGYSQSIAESLIGNGSKVRGR